MADLFKTPQKGQPRPSRSRMKPMTQEDIEASKQKVAVTSKANRPFVSDQPRAPGEEKQRKIVLPATTVYGRQEYMTPLAPKEYWDVNFNEWVNKMEQAQQYCIIYNGQLTRKAMQNISLVVYKYLCFMSTLPDYTDYQLEESKMIT